MTAQPSPAPAAAPAPPAIPDPASLTPAARRILDAADGLFYHRGIHAVGVDALAAAAGVTKKTLYDRYGSKDLVVATYLRARDEQWRRRTEEAVDRAGPPRKGSARRLLATFDLLAEWAVSEGNRGCEFVNAAAELPETDHPGRQVIAAHKLWLADYLTALATEAGLRHPGRTGRRLAVVREGAVARFGISPFPETLAAARDTARLIITDARPRTGG